MNLKSKIVFILIAISLVTTNVYSQTKDQQKAQEYLQDQEISRKSRVMREYDSAVVLMENSNYLAADAKFRYVLANLKSIPSDLTYHFGVNSFHIGKFKQSIDWLNKYIQLKGTGGQFYRDAVQWKSKAELEYVKEKTQNTEQLQQIFSTDYDLDCGGARVVCPVCRGEHVIVKKGPFGNQYRTCAYCDDHGLLSCEEYNKLIRGELRPKQ